MPIEISRKISELPLHPTRQWDLFCKPPKFTIHLSLRVDTRHKIFMRIMPPLGFKTCPLCWNLGALLLHHLEHDKPPNQYKYYFSLH